MLKSSKRQLLNHKTSDNSLVPTQKSCTSSSRNGTPAPSTTMKQVEGLNCDTHVPTLSEIAHINDPVLKEVFASSGIPNVKARPGLDGYPQLPQRSYVARPQQKMIYYGEVPIEHHQQPLGPVPTENSMSLAVSSGVNALATGADVLYRGAATVGEAFGIDTRAYQAPLFSAATQFFGRR
ncbi:unnamed protein product [Angiostrongylus costaricensis]|uniref:ZM domain-containing protein n=1 Tax=Angiostrongylus costaricensis TaxID=334426 RepID=A0A158PF59_ANGCS|nr:unnamed protein product [Angiostrongylus costaricensis]